LEASWFRGAAAISNRVACARDIAGMDEQETGNRAPATGNRQSSMRVGNDIAERLLDFAVTVVRLAATLPKDPAGRHVASQLVRSATGGGANYEEARAAESREDFIHKVGVAAKEVRATVYWLQFIQRSEWVRADLHAGIREAGELAAILSATSHSPKAARHSKPNGCSPSAGHVVDDPEHVSGWSQSPTAGRHSYLCAFAPLREAPLPEQPTRWSSPPCGRRGGPET
jgi:four helix bundle protein